jgi:hypothetical protein
MLLVTCWAKSIQAAGYGISEDLMTIHRKSGDVVVTAIWDFPRPLVADALHLQRGGCNEAGARPKLYTLAHRSCS